MEALNVRGWHLEARLGVNHSDKFDAALCAESKPTDTFAAAYRRKNECPYIQYKVQGGDNR
jgi:hypothetical protein